MFQGGGGRKNSGREGFDVFVGNLPESTTEDQLRRHFGLYGDVVSVTIKQNFGFVKYGTEEECAKAFDGNMSLFNGHKIVVKKGIPKKRGKDFSSSDGGPSANFSGMGNKPDLVSNHAIPKLMASPGGYKPAFRIERKDQLVVSHTEDPVSFWAQSMNDSEKIQEITVNLQALCPSLLPTTARPIRDRIYGAKFSEDDAWYRCQVVDFHSPNQVEVQYIDYGNSEVRDDSELVELPPGLQKPKAQACLFVLSGLVAVHPEKGTQGYEQGVAYFKSLVEPGIVPAEIIVSDHFSTHTPCVLYVNDQDVNQLMLDNGHAEKRGTSRGPSASGGYPKGPHGVSDSQQNRRISPKAKFSTSNKPHQQHKPMPQASPGAPLWLATKVGGDFKTEGSPSDSRDVEHMMVELSQMKDKLAEANIRAEKQRLKYQQEVDHLVLQNRQLMDERDVSSLHLATTKGKLKTAENTVTQLSSDAIRNDFTLKLRTVLRDVNRVRMLRNQFPTDDSQEDLVENALLLLTQDDPLKGSNIMVFVADVESSLGAFNVVQGRIKDAKSVDEVEDILAARDDARILLHKKIEDFLEAVEKFPLDSAMADFQMMVHYLEETYEPYVRNTTEKIEILELEDIQTKWAEWKLENTPAIQDVRTNVNTCHNKVDGLLTQLQEQLRLDSSDTSDRNSSCLSLQQCLTDLQEAIEKEINLTDLEDKDSRLQIRDIIRSLIQSCAQKLDQINVLNGYKMQYEALQMKLAPWLRQKPDLQEVQAMRKNIKSCNSKLRHRLADKLDLEEADDTTSEQIEEVKTKITVLRRELQEALAMQDKLVSNIQEVILNQFPELALEYADLGIKTCAEYSGLVKEGRSLDHFDLEPVDKSSKGVFKSSFCGRPVLLKEYFLDENVSVGKSEFLTMVLSYNAAQSDYLLPLEGVFFTKNERTVITQVPLHSRTLVERVAEADLDYESIQSILRNVAEGMASLHKEEFTHGAINPTHIFINDDNKAIINCVDFMKSTEQRMLSGNPQFAAPEVLAGALATVKSDLYSFGVLAFWLNFPCDSPLQAWPAEAKDTPLQQLVIQLTDKLPEKRPSSSDLLALPYFKTRMKVSMDTLQLRMRTVCAKSENGGILKHSSPVKELPPDVIEVNKPASSQGVGLGDSVDQIVNGETEEFGEEDPKTNGCTAEEESKVEQTENDIEVDPTTEPAGTPENAQDDKKSKYSDNMASQIMFQNEGTPTLPCTPMDTPSNTPIESENNTPANNLGPQDHGLRSAAMQASLETLLAKKPEEGDENAGGDSDGEDSMPALEDGTANEADSEQG